MPVFKFARAHRRRRIGFTLVEMLSVFAILALLIGLLIPAVNAARESARGTICRNHLKQISAAALLHLEAHRHYPTGGWSFDWAPDPDRGYGRGQPGTWTYNLLPFLEESQLHRLGADHHPDKITNTQRQGASRRASTALQVFHCPSRRSARALEAKVEFANADPARRVANSDYAACAGEQFRRIEIETDQPMTTRWRSAADTGGICYQRSLVRPRGIVDGMSKTYLIGEKALPETARQHVGIGELYGMWCYDWGSVRTANAQDLPTQDGSEVLGVFRFGSAHRGAWNMAFCDGSVRSLSYEIDGETHRAQGRRNDLRF